MGALAAGALARIGWRNTRRNWRHSVGAILSIVVGFLAIGLFEGYLHDMKTSLGTSFGQRFMYGDFIVEKRGAQSPTGREEPFRYLLGAEEQRFLEEWLAAHREAVDVRARFLVGSGLASAGRAGVMFIAVGVDVTEGAALRGPWKWNTLAGKPLYLAGPDGVLLGRSLGALLDCVPDPPQPWLDARGAPRTAERPFRCRTPRIQLTATTRAGQLNVIEPTVVGLVDAGVKDFDGKFVSAPLAAIQRLLDTDAISMMTVAARPGVDARALAGALKRDAAARGFDIDALPWTEHPYGEYYARGIEILGIYRTFVVLIVVSIAGMSVFSTMLKAVGERVREIGTLRSLGFRRAHVGLLFTIEALWLAGTAIVLGLVVTVGLTALINAAGITYRAGIMSEAIPLTVGYSAGAYAFATLFLGAVAVFAAWFPARRAARMTIPDALGHA